MGINYFAYGSNLCLPRLRGRVPGVTALGAASLVGYELRWHKRSVDGSGKCSIVVSAGSAEIVHGALFSIPYEEKHLLDQAEFLGNGYDEITIRVRSSHGSTSARTYVAATTHVDESLRPFSWYQDLVVCGAEAHRLPAEYVDRLRRVRALDDHDAERARRNCIDLPCRGTQ